MQLYKRRGFNVAVKHEANKWAIFAAAGIPQTHPRVKAWNHPWGYQGDFNRPDPGVPGWDGQGNKVWGNLNQHPLPPIGPPGELWEELCSVDLEGTIEALITPTQAVGSLMLAGMPRPIVCLATRGNNWAPMKDIPTETEREVGKALLNHGCSLILADWDHRMIPVDHPNVRHVKRDWGHLDLADFFTVLVRCSLVISVDTGPYHYAAFTRVPALGIFRDLHPFCVALPRKRNVNMVRAWEGNFLRKDRWNLVEYAGKEPTADEIVGQALKMLGKS